VSVDKTEQGWQLSMGELTFTVSTTVTPAFFTPGRYALYHLPRRARLLSAEPAIPDDPTPADR
jgi:hypothetical protein